GAIRTLGRPGGAHWTPTLAACAAALPPEGEQFAPWGGPAVLIGPPRLRLAPLRCPRRGSNSHLGAARRCSLDPHACGLRRCAAPGGGAIRTLGRPGGAHWTPTLAACAAALPPEGEQFAPWGGPAVLIGPPRLRLAPLRCPRRQNAVAHPCAARRCSCHLRTGNR